LRRGYNVRGTPSGGYWTGDLEPGWLECEIAGLVRSARQRFPLGRLLARRRMMKLAVDTRSEALVQGRTVRVRGTIGLAPVGGGSSSTALERVRAVEAGADLPDFWLHLADGSSVSIAAAEAGRDGRLFVLDAWEDRQSFATCDTRTPLLFRQSRFRGGQSAEACGVAVQTIDPDQSDVWHRTVGLGWRLIATGGPLVVKFMCAAPATPSSAA
jgi:hypothetical protein